MIYYYSTLFKHRVYLMCCLNVIISFYLNIMCFSMKINQDFLNL